MAQYISPTELDGLFYEAYSDSVENLIPDGAKLTKMIRFVEESKQEGNKYNQPVVLSHEHGVTYAAADEGAFALNDHVAMTMKNAEVQGSQVLLRTAISYEVAAKASSSKKAFVKHTELIVENMLDSITKRVELMHLYGGSATGIGQGTSSANVDGTHTVVTFTAATFAAGIWAGLEGCKMDAYHTSFGTKLSATLPFTVDSVDFDNLAVTFSNTDTTDLSNLDSQLSSGTAEFVFFGAYGKEANGIDKIITNTGSLFGISAATYGLWKGNSYGVGGAALSLFKVLRGLSDAVNRGLNRDTTILLNPTTWEELNDDLAALRTFDQSYKTRKLEIGTSAITYHGQNGMIELIPHIFCKPGEAFAVPLKKIRRLGAQDISFKTPGRGDEIFTHLSDRAGYELRAYTNQAVFIEKPAWCVKYTGITNTA